MWFVRRKREHISLETLSEYLDGRLPESGRRRAELHLGTCDHCREELASLEYAVGLVRRVPSLTPRRTYTLQEGPALAPPLGIRVPAWAYGAVASVAVLFLALLVSADLSGLLDQEASRPVVPDGALEATLPEAGSSETVQEAQAAGLATQEPSAAVTDTLPTTMAAAGVATPGGLPLRDSLEVAAADTTPDVSPKGAETSVPDTVLQQAAPPPQERLSEGEVGAPPIVEPTPADERATAPEPSDDGAPADPLAGPGGGAGWCGSAAGGGRALARSASPKAIRSVMSAGNFFSESYVLSYGDQQLAE